MKPARSIRTGKFQAITLIGALSTTLFVLGCAPQSTMRLLSDSDVSFWNTAIHPDNKTVAINIKFRSPGSDIRHETVVLFDLISQHTKDIGFNRECVWRDPSFSPDGKYLAVAKHCPNKKYHRRVKSNLVVVNLDSNEKKQALDDEYVESEGISIIKSPIFNYDSKFIFAECRPSYSNVHNFSDIEACIIDFELKSLKKFLPSSSPRFSFNLDLSPGTASPKGLLINGRILQGGEFLKNVDTHSPYPPRNFLVRTKGGDLEVTGIQVGVYPDQPGGEVRFLSSSSGRIFAVGVAGKKSSGKFAYEFFEWLGESRYRQATNIGAWLAFGSLSPDGTTAVAFSDVNGNLNPPDLIKVNLETGQYAVTKFRTLIEEFIRNNSH